METAHALVAAAHSSDTICWRGASQRIVIAHAQQSYYQPKLLRRVVAFFRGLAEKLILKIGQAYDLLTGPRFTGHSLR